jgi:trans-aconitate methyltransferase
MLLYGDLVPWYRLIDPPEDHGDEVECYRAGLERAVRGPAETLLELGSGAGHNAVHLKRRFRCTLSDPSDGMRSLSRQLNPECEHVAGDMRTLRLGRTFDLILVHDAVMYMTSRSDLAEAASTAFVHTRPGGAAVFAPDCVRETFRDHTVLLECDSGERSMRGMEWSWDPDPSDEMSRADYVLSLREAGEVRVVHDIHIEGLFSRDTWISLLEGVGYRVSLMKRPLDDGEFDDVFLCNRPDSG